jgi:hypothetical protein
MIGSTFAHTSLADESKSLSIHVYQHQDYGWLNGNTVQAEHQTRTGKKIQKNNAISSIQSIKVERYKAPERTK